MEKITKLVLILFSFLLCGCSNKGKVLLFDENDTTTDYFNMVSSKVIFENEYVRLTYIILSIYKEMDASSIIKVENKTDNEITLINLDWEHRYKNENLERIFSSRSPSTKKDVFPLKIHKGEDAILQYYTRKMKKDFSIGDKISVNVSFYYEYKNQKYHQKIEEFYLRCQLINLPSDMW